MKTVLITGATSGIGKQLAHDYLKKGYRTFACGRSESKLNELVDDFSADGQLETLCFDLSNKQQILDQLSAVDASFDLVILNAGTCEYMDLKDDHEKPQFDASLFERVININLISVAYCIEALLPKMPAESQLVLMASSAAYFPFTRAQAYGASKSAMIYLAKSLAVDLNHSIKVSWVCPGFVETPLTDLNDFEMPMKISTADASTRIIQGIDKGKSEIHFPRRFTYILKILGMLPFCIQRALSAKMKT